MVSLVCKGGEKVYIQESDISYFETVTSQIEFCECREITYDHLDGYYVKKVIQMNSILCKELFIPHEIPSILMTADFLCCERVVFLCIDAMKSIIQKAKSDTELREIFHEKYTWSDDTYNHIKEDDAWCQRFIHSKIKIRN